MRILEIFINFIKVELRILENFNVACNGLFKKSPQKINNNNRYAELSLT